MVSSQAQSAAAPRSAYVSFHAEIIPQTSEALISVVTQQMLQGIADVHLLLSTPGGQVASGIAAYNTLRALPISLTTYNVGSVNSIGNVIFLAGEERFACRTSSFMFHGVGQDFTAPTRMEEKGLVEGLESLRNDQGQIAAIVSERTGIDAEEAKSLFLKAAFMLPAEAKARGIIKEIRDVRVPPGVAVLQLVFKR